LLGLACLGAEITALILRGLPCREAAGGSVWRPDAHCRRGRGHGQPSPRLGTPAPKARVQAAASMGGRRRAGPAALDGMRSRAVWKRQPTTAAW